MGTKLIGYNPATMKHPNTSKEVFEFNLGQALQLRCVHDSGNTICGECESCLITSRLNQVREWFFRAGDESKKRFVLGLVRRLHSVDLLVHLVRLLQPLLCKDFMYARSRTNPSLNTDRCTMSADRAISSGELESQIAASWYWFQTANYWSKWKFMLGVLQYCEAHLLHSIGSQARTLHAAEQNATTPRGGDNGDSVVSASGDAIPMETDFPQSDYSYSQGLSILPTEPSDFGISMARGFSNTPTGERSERGRATPFSEREVINDDSGDDEDAWDEVMQDPTCMIISTSAKAHAGVSRYKDFIRCLPVHISKMILGFLDQHSLYNSLCVSQFWRQLAEGVQREYFVYQNLREEVMLMQGAAAQSCNPVYAKDIDVAVPNLFPGTFEAIRTGDLLEATFKSEISFQTAYSGYSTRNIIMEERNLFCGAYNVMVLLDLHDAFRVMHTDGSQLIALGSQDRRLRFIDSHTGKETGLVISGHAGSVRCVHLNQEEGYVLSGSYDTSIRCWSLETGKCQRIFRGHQDTVTCMERWGDMLASGARDRMCKVWTISTGKCLRTFKHRHPITAVAISEELCISGCEGGKTKVWEIKSGKLIKMLKGHQEPVTVIRFDRWHIITGSCDGYAMAWSAQGNHKRCLTALRHPKAVLCLEFKYLRVITGSEDGKLRIWNMVTGQCLRIMRGNSRSDPITSLIAIGNRVTLNTASTMLVLSFEPVSWDYSLSDDKMPPMVQYSHYGSAPVRNQAYPYIRAQRMLKAGATNMKILHKGDGDSEDWIRESKKSIQSAPCRQTLHSAKTLSKKSMATARHIQSAGARIDTSPSRTGTDNQRSQRSGSRVTSSTQQAVGISAKSVSVSSRPPRPSRPSSRALTIKSRATSAKSGTMVSIGGFQMGHADDDSETAASEPADMRRRVSWAFQNPLGVSETKNLGLLDTKSLLRSQIRAAGEAVPPDFIYLAVNAIQAGMKPTEAGRNMENNRRQQELHHARQQGRPLSCPGRLDPRTMAPLHDLGLDDFRIEEGMAPADSQSEGASRMSYISSQKQPETLPASANVPPERQTVVTNFTFTPIHAKPQPCSLYPPSLHTSIPKGCVVRPHTASQTTPKANKENVQTVQKGRPKSALVVRRPGTANMSVSNVSSAEVRSRQRHGYTSSTTECSNVPMLMYPRDLQEKLASLKERRFARSEVDSNSEVLSRVGAVSPFNSPLRSHVTFKLRTHEQVEEELENITKTFEKQQREKLQKMTKQQQQAWLTKVRGQLQTDKLNFRPRSGAIRGTPNNSLIS